MALTKDQQKVWNRLSDPKWGGSKWYHEEYAVSQKHLSNPTTGTIYFNTEDLRLYLFDGSRWREVVT